MQHMLAFGKIFRYNRSLLKRKGGREVECAGLEIRFTVFRNEGSNPSLSAKRTTGRQTAARFYFFLFLPQRFFAAKSAKAFPKHRGKNRNPVKTAIYGVLLYRLPEICRTAQNTGCRKFQAAFGAEFFSKGKPKVSRPATYFCAA